MRSLGNGISFLGGRVWPSGSPPTPDLEVRGSSLSVTLFRATRNYTPLCLPSPRCITWYRRHTAEGYKTLRWTSIPSSGGVAILHVLGMLHAKETRIAPLTRVRLYRLYLRWRLAVGKFSRLLNPFAIFLDCKLRLWCRGVFPSYLRKRLVPF